MGLGPRGRTRRDQAFSFHPGEEIFIRVDGDPVSYEADLLPGFKERYRYQLIDTGNNVVSVVSFAKDGERFKKAWPKFAAKPEVTLQKRYGQRGSVYRVATLQMGDPVRIASIEWREKAGLAWWDTFSERFEGQAHPRLSLDLMSLIRFRTCHIRDIPRLLTRILEIGEFNSLGNSGAKSTYSMTSHYESWKVDRALAKTLVNYLIDQRGPEYVRHEAFAPIRAYCLGGPNRTGGFPFVDIVKRKVGIQPLDELPQNRHMLYLIANSYQVMGYIKLYSAFTYKVALGANPSGTPFESATLIDFNGPGRMPLPIA